MMNFVLSKLKSLFDNFSLFIFKINYLLHCKVELV